MRKLLIPIAALFLVTGCYEDYVRDFDYAAVYAAYQYDLRTFVLGEGAQFDFSVALGGVMANDRDRAVEISLDESLLTGAVAGMKSQSLVSGDYVSSAFKSFSGSDLTPLPASHYSVSGIEGLTIRKGRHTASVTLRAQRRTLWKRKPSKQVSTRHSCFTSLSKASIPCRAVLSRYGSASAPTPLLPSSR